MKIGRCKIMDYVEIVVVAVVKTGSSEAMDVVNTVNACGFDGD